MRRHEAFRRVASRRTFLKGLGLGAAGALMTPMLQRLEAEASGQPAPKRLVIVLEGNGYYGFRRWDRLNHDSPTETQLTDLAEQLPQARALAPWKDKLVAVNGLDNKQGAGIMAGHRAHWYALTCMPYVGSQGPGGISIDELLGQELYSNTVFPVLRLGAAGKPGQVIGLAPVNCAAGPGQAIATQHNPVEAYLELFGVASSDMEDRAAFEEKRLLLDYMKEDAQRASMRLAAEEKWKFERYLYSIETFQRQSQLLGARVPRLMECSPDKPTMGVEEDVTDHIPKQVDIATAAMVCGLTNVVVLSFASGPFGLTTFGNWGFGGRHGMGHGGAATEMWPGGPAGLIETHNKIAEVIADRMVRELDGVPEGDGTMLDNTSIVFINDNGNQHHSKYNSYPLVMLGDMGGALRTGGRLIEYPNRKQSGTRGLGEFWNTISHAMGAPRDDFGRGGNAKSEGPLNELLP